MYKHQSIDGLSTTNIVYDREALALALVGMDNADDIMAVLAESIDREDNGFRNMKQEREEGYSPSNIESGDRNDKEDNPLTQLTSEESGTSQILDHMAFYLGDNRAWRNGWRSKSFHRHAKACNKAHADNGVTWGEFSMIPTKEEKEASKARKVQVMAKIESKKAKRLSKLEKRFG